MGAMVAEKALRPAGGGRSQSARKPGASRQGQGNTPQLGHPDFSQVAGQSEAAGPQLGGDQQVDNRHVDLGLQHFNMRGLGRDVPYFVWSSLTGNYRALAKTGRPPWDILEDGA